MAYQDVILADNPTIYLTLDGTGIPTDIGSARLTGTVTQGETVIPSQVPAANIPGNSRQFENGRTTSTVTKSNHTLTSLFTYEVWYKKDTTLFDSTTRAILRSLVSSTNYFEITVDQNGLFRAFDRGSTMNDGVTVPSIVDGNWHHLVFVKTAASTGRFYVDGVFVGTRTGTMTGKTGNFIIGSNGAASALGAFIDEAAFYPVALTGAQVANHYSAAYVGADIDSINQAPAISVGPVIAPDPVVRAVDIYHMNVPASEDRRSDSTSNVNGGVNAPTIEIGHNLDLNPNALFKFAGFRMPTGTYISNSAILRLTISRNNLSTITVRPIKQDWVEGSMFQPQVEENVVVSRTLTTSSVSYTVDIPISPLINYWNSNPNFGIAIRSTVQTTMGNIGVDIRTSEFTGSEPRLITDFTQTDGISVMPRTTPMVANVSTPPPVSSTITPSVNQAPVMALSAATGPANVTTTSNALVNAPVMESSLAFLGGEDRLPDSYVAVNAIETYLSISDPDVIAGSDIKVTVPAIELGPVDVVPGSVDTRTDTIVYVDGAMPVALRTFTNIALNINGIVVREEDRYGKAVVPTVDSGDVWYKMDEISGTVAYDVTGSRISNAAYVGEPTFNVEGPQDRRAVRFDGVDDRLVLNLTEANSEIIFTDGSDMTIEFSVRTNQKNGTLWQGRGEGRVTLVNGQMWIYQNNQTVYKVRKDIADGQWHHVIFSMEQRAAYFDAGNQDYRSEKSSIFVQIDGVTEFKRFEFSYALSQTVVPTSVMQIAGDMRDFIVRLNRAISEDFAQNLYYEWVNALVIAANPIVVSLSTGQDTKGRGNVKKMLAVYGLPYAETTFGPRFNYKSVFAGYHINVIDGNKRTYNVEDGYLDNPVTDPAYTQLNPPTAIYYSVAPFAFNGYIIYPVSIIGSPIGSAEGMLNNEYTDQFGQFIDEKTGLRRFIDLDKDLQAPITDFDAVTVMNYPAPRPGGVDPTHPTLQMSDAEWIKARETFRDSVLNAAYQGVSLWINEPWAAVDLGFIQDYDVHTPDKWIESDSRTFSIPAGIKAGYNYAADRLDQLHLRNTGDGAPIPVIVPSTFLGTLGDYYSNFQANLSRRIVSLEPGLTDMPSYEYGEQILRAAYDSYTTNNFIYAYDVVDKTKGLELGDKINMSLNLFGRGATTPAYLSPIGYPHEMIVSAKPQGIVGKVIAREQLSYAQPNTLAEKDNPYRNNAVTIAVERGTVVRGQSIQGRAFIEFMETNVYGDFIPVDRFRKLWQGEVYEFEVTTWDFDPRRYRQTLIRYIEEKLVRDKSANGEIRLRMMAFDRLITNYSEEYIDFKRHYSMHARGLNWLSQLTPVGAGDVKVNAPSVEINLDTPAPTSQQFRSVTSEVIGAMRVDLDLRQPINYRPDSVREKTSPMTLDLTILGVGKIVSAPPLVVNMSLPDAVVRGDGDRIAVYLDEDRRITVFLKEDN